VTAAALCVPPAIPADPVPDPATVPAFHSDAAPPIESTAGPAGAAAARLSPDAAAAAEAGIEALGKNKFDTAEAAFLKLLKLSPDNINALVNLGLVEFRLALRVKPDTALAWMTLGVIYLNQNDIEAATAAFAQAVYLDPKNPQAHNYYAVTLAKRGWYDGAEDELQKVVQLAPDFAEAHFNLALIYFQRNPPAVELARRHYQKALELGAQPDPDFAAKLNAAPEQTEVQ
jgi:Flp pilus assembly protein TadD